MNDLLKNLDSIQDNIDPEFEEYIASYYDNRKLDLDKMYQYLNNGDIGGVAAIAHKILGTAKTYGLNQLDQIALELEKCSKYDKDLDRSRLIVEVMDDYIADKISSKIEDVA